MNVKVTVSPTAASMLEGTNSSPDSATATGMSTARAEPARAPRVRRREVARTMLKFVRW